SESLVAYELGYRTQVRQRLSLSASSYYNDYDKLRSVERPNGPLANVFLIGNGLRGKSYGAELEADYRLMESWRVRAAYTPLHIGFSLRPGSTDATSPPGTNESHDSNQRFSARSSVDLPGRLEYDVA